MRPSHTRKGTKMKVVFAMWAAVVLASVVLASYPIWGNRAEYIMHTDDGVLRIERRG